MTLHLVRGADSDDNNPPGAHPRIMSAASEADDEGLGKIVRQFNPYAKPPRIARSFEGPAIKVRNDR